MYRFLVSFLSVSLLMAAQPLFAQSAGNSRTLVLPLSSALTDNKMARVITSGGRPAECLAPVSVNRIDGETRVVSAKGFFIEPGIHTINGKAMLDISNCPLTGSNPTMISAVDLEVDFEPGGTYHIGYYHAPVNTEEWKLVVWHIENDQ